MLLSYSFKGFMYLRYTQPPGDLYDWYEDYLQDEEEIDVKAGGGQTITIGQTVYQFLTKLDWFSTLFPRIPVPIQKQIEKKLQQYCQDNGVMLCQLNTGSRKVSAPPAETNRGNYEENYDQRHTGRGDNGNHAVASGSYRWEHDDRDVHRDRRRDDFDPYGDRERVRDHDREKKSERERDRGRRGYERIDERRDYDRPNERRDYERIDERRDYERVDERRDFERIDERRDFERNDEKRDYERADDRREGRERVRDYDEKERHRDKHKKKKRKHHRSRSRSRVGSKRDRKREREAKDNSDGERKRR